MMMTDAKKLSTEKKQEQTSQVSRDSCHAKDNYKLTYKYRSPTFTSREPPNRKSSYSSSSP